MRVQQHYAIVCYKKCVLPNGGAIWRPYTFFVACMCSRIVITCVVIESPPGYYGYVAEINSCGVERMLGRVSWYARRSWAMLISCFMVSVCWRMIVR